MRIAIVEQSFEPLDELKDFERRNAKSGALATFVGRCRPLSQGKDVAALELQHYPGFTEKEIARVAGEIAARLQLRDVCVIHRVGTIAPAQAIVLVAAASDHRAEALGGVETIIDFLKTDAPLWKREVTADGARWIEPTADDHARRQTWIVKP